MEQTIQGALLPGTTLDHGRYIITRTLGQGATAITYLATTQQTVQGNLGTAMASVQVAIKEFFLKDECQRVGDTSSVGIINTNNAQKIHKFREAFANEARKLAKLSHPNIVNVTSLFEDKGTFYYVMDYLPGGSLRDIVARGPLPEALALSYVTDVAAALLYMHNQSMCHYDVKPANIMLAANGTNGTMACLLDFGIAKNYDSQGQGTTTTPVGLTKGFAPIEQYRGVTTFSPAIDTYSLGATLCNLLTGEMPPDPTEDMKLPPKPANVSERTWQIVRRAMAYLSYQRPTMAQMLQMLQSTTPIDQIHPLPQTPQTPQTPLINPINPTPPINPTTPPPPDTPGETLYDDDPPRNPDASHATKRLVYDSPTPTSRRLRYIVLAVVAFCLCFAITLFCMKGCGSTKSDTPTAGDTTAVVGDTIPQPFLNEDGEEIGTFIGPMQDGQPAGRGTLRYNADNPKHLDRYVGTFVNGRREGKDVKLYYQDGTRFFGHMVGDHFYKGTLYKPNDEYFVGDFHNDIPWNGKWYSKDGQIAGHVKNGVG